MKFEETSDITTLLVEATNQQTQVVRHVVGQRSEVSTAEQAGLNWATLADLESTVLQDTEPLPLGRRQPDRLMLALIVLLVLGILGGVGFGYLATMIHTTSGGLSPETILPFISV